MHVVAFLAKYLAVFPAHAYGCEVGVDMDAMISLATLVPMLKLISRRVYIHFRHGLPRF